MVSTRPSPRKWRCSPEEGGVIRTPQYSIIAASRVTAGGLRRSPNGQSIGQRNCGSARISALPPLPIQASRATCSSREKARGWASSRSQEHTSELQSLMRKSYAALCLETKPQRHELLHIHRLLALCDITTVHTCGHPTH